MFLGHLLLLAALITLQSALASPALAEKPDYRPEELQAKSAIIIAGKVQQIYEAVEKSKNYLHADGVVELKVQRSEKGDFKPGDVVYLRFWSRKWIGDGHPPPGSNGHRDIPKKDGAVRIFAIKGKDGGYDVMLPNGFELISDKAKPSGS